VTGEKRGEKREKKKGKGEKRHEFENLLFPPQIAVRMIL